MRRKTGHIRNLAFSENVLGYWPKLLHTHIQNYVMRSFDQIFIHFWIIQDFRFHPCIICVLFSAYKSGMLDLTNIIGVWFGSPPKVLRMTKGVGPWLARSGHRGSKRVKTHSTSRPYLTLFETFFWARNYFSSRFWTKNFFESGFGVEKYNGDPLGPSEHGRYIFEKIFESPITLWIGGP